jgi:uncharacterized protein (DUF433 family)
MSKAVRSPTAARARVVRGGIHPRCRFDPRRAPPGTACASPAPNAMVWFAIMDALARITHDPKVMGGRPCIRGMRVTVGTIVGLLAAGQSADDILEAYPYLEREDIQAALSYPAWRSEELELPIAH